MARERIEERKIVKSSFDRRYYRKIGRLVFSLNTLGWPESSGYKQCGYLPERNCDLIFVEAVHGPLLKLRRQTDRISG